jgi:chemotaxis protein methyltransferase CheR
VICAADYSYLSALLLRTSGLHLGSGREYLIESRLTPVASRLGFSGVADLITALRLRPDPQMIAVICEAMTTNETFFFRDGAPFDLLRQRLLPELVAARRHTRQLRIWSAAASTGQEAYSIAMTIACLVPSLADWRVEIVATDYSPAALDRARAGVYNSFEAQRGLPEHLLKRFFRQVGPDWQINEEMRRAVTFREGNLLEPFGHLGPFDLILCRNVLIYFDTATKREVLNRITHILAPDGYLFLGSAETALGLCDHLSRVPDAATSVFRRSNLRGQPGLVAALEFPRLDRLDRSDLSVDRGHVAGNSGTPGPGRSGCELCCLAKLHGAGARTDLHQSTRPGIRLRSFP